jgi:hypothetical protein
MSPGKKKVQEQEGSWNGEEGLRGKGDLEQICFSFIRKVFREDVVRNWSGRDFHIFGAKCKKL